MANDVVPNGIKIEWNYTQNTIPVVNRVYVTKTGAISSGDLDDAVIEALAFYNSIRGFQHPSCILQDITCTDVSVANGVQVVLPLVTDNAGTGSGTAAAANAAMVASLRTDRIGRSFRGRFYLGGMTQNQLDTAQNFTTGSTATFASAWTDFIDALTAVNMTLVVVSRFAAGVARVVNLATEIISVVVDTKVDSQRRRTAN